MGNTLSKNDIANVALTHLGQPSIASIDNVDIENARILTALWDMTRDAVLQIGSWDFATKRAQLSPDVDAPAFEWLYQYTMPIDFIAMNRIYPYYNDISYTIEEEKLLTNEGPVLNMVYTARKELVGTWSPMFVNAFALLLAAYACEAITQSNTKVDRLLALYDLSLKQAAMSDASQNPVQPLPDDAWLEARR